ncbi:hypothetical protein AMK20_02675 [Streptomyces sp. TSRI0261]|nr:hypothetical protein AMK20_02675 [Streptomyces sp. TSRI0261]
MRRLRHRRRAGSGAAAPRLRGGRRASGHPAHGLPYGRGQHARPARPSLGRAAVGDRGLPGRLLRRPPGGRPRRR